MQKNFNLLDLQNKLGYVFKNAELIRTAFIHKSSKADIAENNSRLVFLGEKLLDFVISDYVFAHSSSNENERFEKECRYYLNAVAPEKYIKERSLNQYAVLSAENENLRESDTLATEIFYALTAAIYKDGGLPTLKSFLLPIIRCGGVCEPYTPSAGGKVLTRSETVVSEEKHISSARSDFKSRRSIIGISRAETINNDTDNEKPSNRKFAKAETKIEEKASDTEVLPQKRFIRDPFAPVKLSDDLRNFKPKKPSNYNKSTPYTETSISSDITTDKEISLESNYKSLLQELIQKNIRTANVSIKYEVNQLSKNDWTSTVMLSNEKIGFGKGSCKKDAEKSAAEHAYNAISDKKSAEYKWFLSLCTDGTPTLTTPNADYISKLNRYFQKAKHLSSAPVDYKKKPSSEKGIFIFAIEYDGKELAAGKATTAKEAKQNAAKIACEILKIN